jgi:hypothetical protein
MNQIRFIGGDYKWQIVRSEGETSYHDPDSTMLHIKGATLYNNKQKAEETFTKGVRDWCAHIICDEVVVGPVNIYMTLDLDNNDWIGFNPDYCPHWRDIHGNDLDDYKYPRLFTVGKHIYRI